MSGLGIDQHVIEEYNYGARLHTKMFLCDWKKIEYARFIGLRASPPAPLKFIAGRGTGWGVLGAPAAPPCKLGPGSHTGVPQIVGPKNTIFKKTIHFIEIW
jgi:hypothetical protein